MNRLAAEASPYLQQHRDNPVDWQPWGEAAFAEARRRNVPIFLSIGYSTCHWCHVMAHESFESAGVAAVLNRDFVAVKVDREERPDVDRVYMAFVQASTGSGGWPMSVWLTPDLKPFFGGTYFPPESRWGRPGFTDILQEIARAWREEREKVVASADTILGRLREASSGNDAGDAVPGTDVLASAVGQFATAYDHRHGGFGGAPKFPRPAELLFLLREAARTGEAVPGELVSGALTAMATGGLRDHLGGGFHRYSVDAAWRVPHFEKMLYDQAQLALAYLETAQATGDAWFADIAEETLAYVERELTDISGGLHSAEDADSIPPELAGQSGAHGSEGAFYIWRDAELGAVLGGDAEPFRLRYGCLPDGNAPSDPHGEFRGQNLLYLARPVSQVAELLGMTEAAVEAALARARAALAEARATRPRPHRDDKVLTAWNGLMLAAFARAGRVLPDQTRWLAAATRTAGLLVDTMWDGAEGRLYRCFRAGQRSIPGFAEDYAAAVWGLLETFQSTGSARWLEAALAMQAAMDRRFADPRGGWFSTEGTDPAVLIRMKEDYDGAEPSATAVGAGNLLLLAHLTGEAATAEAAGRALASAAGTLSGMPRAVPMLLAALSTFHAGLTQVVVVGPAGRKDTEALRQVVAACYVPASVVVPVEPGDADLLRLLPWLAPLTMRDGLATAYVCRGFACDQPVSAPDELRAILSGHGLSR